MKKLVSLFLASSMVFMLAACGGSNTAEAPAADGAEATKGGSQAAQTTDPGFVPKADGSKYVIGVSLPSPANQWVGAMIESAKREAGIDTDKFDVIVTTAENPAKQVSDIEDIMLKNPDALVVFPLESAPVTPICERAYDKGVKTIIVDRGIDSEKYTTYLSGDNAAIGIQSAHYIGKQLGGKGKIVEIVPIPCAIEKERRVSFKETLEKYYPDIEIIGEGMGNFNREDALSSMEDLLQAHPQIDAVYSPDDEQALGVIAAVKASGRTDVKFTTGAGGNKGAYEMMKSGEKLMGASISYTVESGGSSVRLAKLLAQGVGMKDMTTVSVPRRIVLQADVVTAENVDKFYNPNSSY